MYPLSVFITVVALLSTGAMAAQIGSFAPLSGTRVEASTRASQRGTIVLQVVKIKKEQSSSAVAVACVVAARLYPRELVRECVGESSSVKISNYRSTRKARAPSV